ncbi:MAG: hypothetical protein A2340_00005 [Lentisphaerae bacterium RIFOXYB12_FULL_60_10]|nr:MAG: hypothetical protein A2340_00005 [Lentisphaerae bacterium RIFOXYB12_FULL_60_10]
MFYVTIRRHDGVAAFRHGILPGLVTLILLASFPASAADYYVATNGNDGAAGTNWATALQTISTAVAGAVDGDVIRLSNGVHNLAAEIIITKSIHLLGVWGRDQTVVRRSGASDYRLFTVSNATAVLEGIELRNGRTSNNYGGGAWLYAGTIRDCNLNNNGTYANSVGGAVHVTGGTIRDCNVMNNWGASGGGGLNLAGPCLVSNCYIAANGASHGGAGIRITSAQALVARCVIRQNTNSYYTGGGGIYLNAGTVRNCLITGNRQTLDGSDRGGGGVRQAGGALLNCTIAGNQVLGGNVAGGVWWTAGSITNTIVYGNVRGTAADNLLAASLTTIVYSCAPELTNGTGNVSQEPDFIDLAGGNYRLAAASPCIDSGIARPDLVTDLDGVVRPIDGDGVGGAQWDMGAYEAQSASGGEFRCSFSGSPRVGMAPLEVVYEASVAGPDTNGLVYYWDVDGDGTHDRVGSSFGVLTNVYAPGLYTVTLCASNAAANTAQVTKVAYVTVQAPALFVSTAGSHTSPFTNWVMAATNLADAMMLVGDGTILTVTNGVYNCIEQQIPYNTIVRSVNGSTATTLRNPVGSTARLFVLTHPQAVVEGFTLTGGIAGGGSGGAVWMSAGTVRNCILDKNTASGVGMGGAVYMTGGSVRDCEVINNYGASGAGGIYLAGSCLVSNCFISRNKAEHGGAGIRVGAAGAVATRCLISNNTNTYYSGGGGIYLSAGTVRNCLITGNRVTLAGATVGGGGVHLAGGLLLNSTIVSNRVLNADNIAGGVWWKAGGMTNTIVYGNQRVADDDNLFAAALTTIGYSCAPELVDGVNGNLTADPSFKNPGAADYRLSPDSPCIDKGRYLAWMAGETDLAGLRRVLGPHSDIGAYEYEPPGGSVFAIR